MENKNFSGLSLSVIALLLVVLVGTGVYAYYASEATGTAAVRALRYAFTANTADTVEEDTFTLTVDSSKFQPGTAIAVPVALSAAGSEVGVVYTVSARYAGGSETITNLDVCTAAAPAGVCPEGKDLALGTDYIQVATGTIGAGSSADANFYLAWPYGTDASDTADQGKTITLEVKVTGQQVRPTS